MSNATNEPHLAQDHRDPGRGRDRARQDRATRRAARQESWLEQLQRIAEQTKSKPTSEN
jgi:hypothetical protein